MQDPDGGFTTPGTSYSLTSGGRAVGDEVRAEALSQGRVDRLHLARRECSARTYSVVVWHVRRHGCFGFRSFQIQVECGAATRLSETRSLKLASSGKAKFDDHLANVPNKDVSSKYRLPADCTAERSERLT